MHSADDVSRKRSELKCCSLEHNDRDNALDKLARALYYRFGKEWKIDDLEEAIGMHRAALELRPVGHPHRRSSLLGLALCLLHRYDIQGPVADLEEVILLKRAALELCLPGDPDRGLFLDSLGTSLRTRFQKQAVMRDLEEAIDLHHAALELHPLGHPYRHSSRHGLALCLLRRYENQGVVANLEEVILLKCAALELCPHGDPDHGLFFDILGTSLRMKFQKQAAMHDLGEAMELHNAALELCPPGHPYRCSLLLGLALCLLHRYNIQGVVADLEEVILLKRAALGFCPPGDPNRGLFLDSLGTSLWMKFHKQTVMRDLEEAIELHRTALELHRPGHPWRLLSVRRLGFCYWDRYRSLRMTGDLEEAIALARSALVICPPGHADRTDLLHTLAFYLRNRFSKWSAISNVSTLPRVSLMLRPPGDTERDASSLYDLALRSWDQFRKCASPADLDEAISLAAFVMELRPSGHPYHALSFEKLTLFLREWVHHLRLAPSGDQSPALDRAAEDLRSLAKFLRDRSRNERAITDLDEAITLHRYVLQLRPTGHPRRPSCLHDLAQCLADRFRYKAATSDLDKAIALEQEALRLFTRGEPDYHVSLDSLTTYLEMKISPRVGMAISGVSRVDQVDIKQLIRDVAFDVLKSAPTRLLHTQTGTLCDRDTQISHFLGSRQCNELLSSVVACCPDQRVESIRAAVLAYFRYVMLSHRWGEDEPSLRDVEGSSIYSMSTKAGHEKLQAFCLIACKKDYLWAWSDTCCIDKDSSAELQEAIGSMFRWYRRSALTIVYLADVSDAGSFSSSKWFGRGWTLQELLAPRTVLFYTQNWSLYKNLTSSNHKTDSLVIGELESTTRIVSPFLIDCSPGMDDARSRLQWASSRRTTRPEDIAYSLFGIFNLHLPVLYGESAENALGRLLAEIISQSGEISVLDWVGEASTFHSCFPAHITSYRTLPLSPHHQPDAEERASTMGEKFTPSKALRKLHDSLAKSPLPRFMNRRLILPCLVHRVTMVQLKKSNSQAERCTYEIQASGLRPLEIALPHELENVTMSPGTLYLVRPWHSKLLSQSTGTEATSAEHVILTLGRPFNALLLTKLPHDEYKRIASSTLIVAQPVDSASLLQSKIRTFTIV